MVKGNFDLNKAVIARIEAYMECNEWLRKYKICSVMQYEHPDDHYLYKVLARDTVNNTYTYWTAWNDSTYGLNHGHYDLDKETAYRCFLES